MYIVTGGGGFIGSNIVGGLNARGVKNIVVVDPFSGDQDLDNLNGLEVKDYIHHDTFARELCRGRYKNITAIIHQGACSDTMETDEAYVMAVNYEYSKSIFEYCAAHRIPLIYASSASVYGNNLKFREISDNENPLNLYAKSKLLFDDYVRRNRGYSKSQVVGLRYFNVYGPREQNKGRMASVAFHFYNQMTANGRVDLFEGSDGYAAGEQLRDFVWVEDVVNVNLYFLDNPEISGVYNVGTGRARTFNDLAATLINTMNESDLTLGRLVESGYIRYIPFPQALRGKYQSFTQADITALGEAGYANQFTSLEHGIKAYVRWRRGQ